MLEAIIIPGRPRILLVQSRCYAAVMEPGRALAQKERAREEGGSWRGSGVPPTKIISAAALGGPQVHLCRRLHPPPNNTHPEECRPLSRQQHIRCATWAAAPRYSPRPNVATQRCCGDQSGPTPSPSSSPSPTAAHTCTAPRRHRLSIAVQRTFETIQSGILAVKS